MSKLKNLSYRIKSYFMGESGIVEKVQEYHLENKNNNSPKGYSLKDSFGNMPQSITFENLLGEIKTQYAMEEKVIVNNRGFKTIFAFRYKTYNFAFRYKTYKIWDKFP